MMTVRLPEELEREVARIASTENRTKTDVVREALAEYIGHRAARKSAYELGEDLFGVYGSGEGSRSQTYKQRLKEGLHAKHDR